MAYYPIIGIEVHVELKTKSKMFCGCDANFFGKQPNSHCCPVCLGMPGALPVPNRQAVDWCLLIGMALNCGIPKKSKFDRKNYFYPDLAKGYQISQYDSPFCQKGWIMAGDRKIGITRVHMEEDTGKLTHATVNGETSTLIDFNRSGVPLVEIVSDPDIHSSEEAKIYLKKIQQLIRYLGVSDADMEKGSFRCEPNISLMPISAAQKQVPEKITLPDYKVEIKNINSFKFAADAIDYEIKRQTVLLDAKEKVKQETRRWNEDKHETYSQRSKEEAKDYRYFPEPDIPPIQWTEKDIQTIRQLMPKLPDEKLSELLAKGITQSAANILIKDRKKGALVEDALKLETNDDVTISEIVNMVVNEKIDIKKTTPEQLRKLIAQSKSNQLGESELKQEVENVIKENPKVAEDIKQGQMQAMGFLIGIIMRKTNGKANPQIASKLLQEIIRK